MAFFGTSRAAPSPNATPMPNASTFPYAFLRFWAVKPAQAAAFLIAFSVTLLVCVRVAAQAKPASPPALGAGSGAASGIRPAAPLAFAQNCTELPRRLPNVSEGLCKSAQLLATGARTVRGLPILMRDVPPAAEGFGTGGGGAAPQSKPAVSLRVLVIGAIHGDELSAAALALHWIRIATEGSPGSAPANLPQVHWRFVPMLNADGLLAREPSRVNARGVDLNRNFPTPNWASEARKYWEQRTNRDPRRYPGAAPLSEPEAQFIMRQMQEWQPHAIIAIHAPYGVLDFDGPSVPPTQLGRLYLDQVGIFPGSLGNYGGVHQGVPVVTVELPSALRTPLDAEMRQMWLDLLRWITERLPVRASEGGNGNGNGAGKQKAQKGR